MVYEVPAGNIVPFDSLVPVPLAKGLGGVKEGEAGVGGVDLLQGGVGEGVYAPAPQEVPPPLYVLHQPHKKDGVSGLEQPGDSLVLGGREGGDGAFPRVGGEGTTMMPIGAEFSLISSSCYETNMAQLSTAYHGSDTDSEVALTLASLGTPKLERAGAITGNSGNGGGGGAGGSSGLAQAFQDLEPQQVSLDKKVVEPPPPPQRPTLVLRSRRNRATAAHHTTLPSSTSTTTSTTSSSTTASTATTTTSTITRKRRRKDPKVATQTTTTTPNTTTAATTTGGAGSLEEGGNGSGGNGFLMPDSVLAVRSVPSPAPATAATSTVLQQQEAQKENLLGQLLKASEQCEPASLIPAGVVDDVIPAVGYRIMDMTNLGEMVRMMHRCPGLGTIVIQEQASLREGAVSQLSVICTSCQEGAVCATSNRAAQATPWDINARVEQLTKEFSIKEDQLQRMLEILGIFYRPCDPALQPITQPVEVEAAAAQSGAKKKKKKKSDTAPSGKPKNLVCTVCKQRFVGVNHLKKHMHSHDLNLHTCPYCHAYFKKPFNLKEHIKKHQNCKYECSHCQREFTDKSTLLCHVRSQHEKRYKIQCELCQKRFYHRAHYNEHMRIHTGEKPYMCELCGKKFSWHDSVKKHMQTHSAESKYKCRLCGKWFRLVAFLLHLSLVCIDCLLGFLCLISLDSCQVGCQSALVN
ncbi:Zinc finger and BTB domain-containing protein 47 [Portunus trituberculatus]|uniref:Zinc finger and BTB domain-containing protein 47 n=1 Tax=Portunus trituberculatus TaxID=210409 RepID=A0A5B7CWF6_PORTR|nr:Zinc finger and BTB domain-containing protein 47 [Portunus trituberculatus]